MSSVAVVTSQKIISSNYFWSLMFQTHLSFWNTAINRVCVLKVISLLHLIRFIPRGEFLAYKGFIRHCCLQVINHLIRSIRVHLFIVIPDRFGTNQTTNLPAEGSQATEIRDDYQSVTLGFLQLPCEEVPSKPLPVVFHDVLYTLFASGQDWEPCEHCPQTIFLPDMIRTYRKNKTLKGSN